jgi:two-component system chemotaxis response regulator CheY
MQEITYSDELLPVASRGKEPLKVLLIDDSLGTRRFLAPMLRNQGANVVGETSDGREGLALYEKLKPDLVFLDIVMPVMSGLEVLKRIKEMNPQAIVVMLTSIADRESVIASKKAGAFSYLLKPFNTKQVKHVVDEVRRYSVQGKGN